METVKHVCKNTGRCNVRFDVIETELKDLKEHENRRMDQDRIIETAIVKIQVANELISQTLSKLEKRMDTYIESLTNNNAKTNDRWIKIMERVLLILAGVIGALIGQKII